jgi:hypothetical protein
MFFTRQKEVTTLGSLQAKKENILSVFTRTRDELSQLIEQQEGFKASIEQQIINLQLDKDSTDKSISSSKSILSKIKSILE